MVFYLRNEVLAYADENGLKAATTHFNVPITKIWQWRGIKKQRQKKDQQMKNQSRIESDQSDESILPDIQSEDSNLVSSQSETPSKRRVNWSKHDVDNAKKQEIIDDYLKMGMGPAAEKHNIPRQTIRNWALKSGKVSL